MATQKQPGFLRRLLGGGELPLPGPRPEPTPAQVAQARDKIEAAAQARGLALQPGFFDNLAERLQAARERRRLRRQTRSNP